MVDDLQNIGHQQDQGRPIIKLWYYCYVVILGNTEIGKHPRHAYSFSQKNQIYILPQCYQFGSQDKPFLHPMPLLLTPRNVAEHVE